MVSRCTDRPGNFDKGPILDEATNAKWKELMTRFAQLLQLFEGGLLASRDEFVSQVKTQVDELRRQLDDLNVEQEKNKDLIVKLES